MTSILQNINLQTIIIIQNDQIIKFIHGIKHLKGKNKYVQFKTIKQLILKQNHNEWFSI